MFRYTARDFLEEIMSSIVSLISSTACLSLVHRKAAVFFFRLTLDPASLLNVFLCSKRFFGFVLFLMEALGCFMY